MATSPNTGHRTAGTISRHILTGLLSLSRYDVVLAAMPLVFALALVASAVSAVSFHLAIAAGAVTSALLLVEILYLNPPVNSRS